MVPSYADKLFPAQTQAILLKVALDDVCDHVEATEEQGQLAVQTHSVLLLTQHSSRQECWHGSPPSQ